MANFNLINLIYKTFFLFKKQQECIASYLGSRCGGSWVSENFKSFVLKVLLRSTGLWDSIRYSCKLSFFHNSLVHSYCHPLQFSLRNSNNLSIRLETPIYYRRNRRWSFVYKPTISIFFGIGKEHFSHFPPNFFLSFALFNTVQIALKVRSGLPPPPIPLYRLGKLFFMI